MWSILTDRRESCRNGAKPGEIRHWYYHLVVASTTLVDVRETPAQILNAVVSSEDWHALSPRAGDQLVAALARAGWVLIHHDTLPRIASNEPDTGHDLFGELRATFDDTGAHIYGEPRGGTRLYHRSAGRWTGDPDPAPTPEPAMPNRIPDNARPTTPCDQWLKGDEALAVYGASANRKCGNTWGTPWPERPDFAECTRCHHVCGHGPDHGNKPAHQPFRFLTGPEIAARLYTPEAHNVLSGSITLRQRVSEDGNWETAWNTWRDAVDRYVAAARPAVVEATLHRIEDGDFDRVDMNMSDGTIVSIDITDPYNPTLIERTQ